MPAGLEALIDKGFIDSGKAFVSLTNARNHLYYVGDAIEAENWGGAKTQLYNAADDFGLVAKYLMQNDVFYEGLTKDWRDALYWINDNWPSDTEVTMDAILNAMFSASFNQLQKFIGIEDAYRVALWNAPFNAEFYASLARGFIKWP